MARTISLLDEAAIPEPCPVAWGSMRGCDERVRFCANCQKHVHNLSAMSHMEAEQLLRDQVGNDLCVQMMRGRRGEVITHDGWRRYRLWRGVAAMITACFAMVGAGCGALGGQVAIGGSVAKPAQSSPATSEPASTTP